MLLLCYTVKFKKNITSAKSESMFKQLECDIIIIYSDINYTSNDGLGLTG